MPRSWKHAVPLLLALMSLATAPSASAASLQAGTRHFRTVTPVTFTLTTACSSLHSNVSGGGNLIDEITVITYGNGSSKVIDNSTAHGRATDANGVVYTFSYANHTVSHVPPSGSPIQVEMMDHFTMNGAAGGDHVNVGILWHWSYVPLSDGIPTSSSPGLWPPGSDLVKVTTIGDVVVTPTGLTCDAI